jgi:5,5'-dehydrodivanillate O-demethylase oxygenase subunit
MTLSVELNEKLTRVGPGTPCGELMRRYWHPIASVIELEHNPTKRVRLLCEDLVLYCDRAGTYGLIDNLCAHRRVDMFYGIPEEMGLRCPYHGWRYDESGQCIEQPFEETANPSAHFKDRVKMKAYPVQTLGGLVWAYLGPEPTPLLPRWEPIVRDNSLRDLGVTLLPCNWLQAQENSLDPVHTEWLHGAFTDYALQRQGKPPRAVRTGNGGMHKKIGFDVFEHGIIKRRVTNDETEEDPAWKNGHPVLFPNILLVGSWDAADFQIRVPVDDTHTMHYYYVTHTPGVPVPAQLGPVVYPIPLANVDETGAPPWPLLDTAPGQDMMAWWTQGPIARRELERLGVSDEGIILFRKLLEQQIDLVARGEDPMNTFRDPAANQSITLQTERLQGARAGASKYSPLSPELQRLFEEGRRGRERAAAGSGGN